MGILSPLTQAGLNEDIIALKQEWAELNFFTDDETKEGGLKILIDKAKKLSLQHHDIADVLIWERIIRASYAGAAGGLSALSEVKQAKRLFERAIELNPSAMAGSAYTSLGSLYYQVPGWPIGFGSDEKAKVMLEKGLALNPQGADANFFFAEFLADQKKYQQAISYYKNVLHSPARADQPTADRGRKMAAEQAINKLRKKLGQDPNIVRYSKQSASSIGQ